MEVVSHAAFSAVISIHEVYAGLHAEYYFQLVTLKEELYWSQSQC